jgi:hypothetical protein
MAPRQVLAQMTYKPADLGKVLGKDMLAALRLEFGRIAQELATLQAPVPAPSPDVLWRWNADSIAPFFEQSKVPGRATLLTVNGVKAVRLHTEPGDNNVAGSGMWERNDLALSQADTDGYEGKDHWWAHSILFPDDYVDPPQSEVGGPWNASVVFDFHNTTAGGGQANMQIMAMPKTAISPDRPTGLSFQIASGTQANPVVKNYPFGPIERNRWYDFRYHVFWTSATTGLFDAWVNGVQKMAYRGPTLYAGQGTYLKLANYHTAHGKASAVLHGRVIRARTQAALA